jgi:hypothetical protein
MNSLASMEGKELSKHLIGATEDNHKKHQLLQPVFRERFEPGSSQMQVKASTATANLLCSHLIISYDSYTEVRTQRKGISSA